MISTLADILILGSVLLGHIWMVFLIMHHVHSARMEFTTISLLTKITQGAFLVAFCGWGWWFYVHGFDVLQLAKDGGLNVAQISYLAVFAALGAVAVPLWVAQRLSDRPPHLLKRHHRTTFDIAQALDTWPVNPGRDNFFARLPGNQALKIDLVELTLEIPRLHPALDQFSILHLSDIHFGHAIRQNFFEEVVRISNAQEAHFIAITGDILDKKQCLPWIPETLGKLRAELGVYFILGNHDWLLHDLDSIQEAIRAAGHEYLGSNSKTISFNGQEIVLAGNELPWFQPAADPAKFPPRDKDGTPLRLLLAHSPDQFNWAREHDFDLMLAGHTHGGQIALPHLGPLFTASRTGTAYSAGTFHRDATIMHVSRGVSGSRALRYNSPQEIAKITLRCPKAQSQQATQGDENVVIAGRAE